MDVLGILGADTDARNGFNNIKVVFDIDADATPDEIKALVAQSQKRSAVYDIIANPTNITVEWPDPRHRDGRLVFVRTTAIVIGAGHAGLAMSRCLANHWINHVVLERGEVANSWQPSAGIGRLLAAPNWMSRLPGYGYERTIPTAIARCPDQLPSSARYAEVIAAPVQTRVTATSVRRNELLAIGSSPTR